MTAAASAGTNDRSDVMRRAARQLRLIDGMTERITSLLRRDCESADLAREMDDICCELEMARCEYETLMAALS